MIKQARKSAEVLNARIQVIREAFTNGDISKARYNELMNKTFNMIKGGK